MEDAPTTYRVVVAFTRKGRILLDSCCLLSKLSLNVGVERHRSGIGRKGVTKRIAPLRDRPVVLSAGFMAKCHLRLKSRMIQPISDELAVLPGQVFIDVPA